MWLYILGAVVAGLGQSFLTGWWGDYPFFNLPALAVMAVRRRGDFYQTMMVALVAGFCWDFINPPLGLMALIMLVAALIVFYIERQWWPARGGLATAVLLIIMVLIIRYLTMIFNGQLAIINGWWLREALVTGFIGGLLWRQVKQIKSDFYGR